MLHLLLVQPNKLIFSHNSIGRLEKAPIGLRFFWGTEGLKHPALAGGAHGTSLGQPFAVVGAKVAHLVLPTRAAPAAVVATHHRDRLLLGTENQPFEALAKIHAANLRGGLPLKTPGV